MDISNYKQRGSSLLSGELGIPYISKVIYFANKADSSPDKREEKNGFKIEIIKISNYVMKKNLINQKLYRAGKIAGYMQAMEEFKHYMIQKYGDKILLRTDINDSILKYEQKTNIKI